MAVLDTATFVFFTLVLLGSFALFAGLVASEAAWAVRQVDLRKLRKFGLGTLFVVLTAWGGALALAEAGFLVPVTFAYLLVAVTTIVTFFQEILAGTRPDRSPLRRFRERHSEFNSDRFEAEITEDRFDRCEDVVHQEHEGTRVKFWQRRWINRYRPIAPGVIHRVPFQNRYD